MTIRLTVRAAIWRSQVAQTVSSVPGLVPVVKGNGYGFGRHALAHLAAEFSDTIAVGNVHELDGLPPGLDVVVLTPTLLAPEPSGDGGPILTVGCTEHLDALDAWTGRVIVKLSSSMRRFGGSAALVDAARARGLEVVGVSVHPPTAGTDDDHAAEVAALLPTIDPNLTVWISHVGPDAAATLPDSHDYRLRIGTALWHGDKSALHLTADVLDVRAVGAGTPAGYHQGVVAGDGHLVVIGAGTANGVSPLPDGRSPFHFERTRLALHEPPHMHVSMVFVPDGDPLPAIGDEVDVQRPLHMALVDEFRWI